MTQDIYKKQKEQKEVISSAKNAIIDILKMDNVLEKHKRHLIKQMIWAITEADGLTAEKRTGYKKRLTYVSELVKKRIDSGNHSVSGIEHEHVWMMAGIIDRLIANKEGLEKVLKGTIACAVTKEEHKRLPHNSYDENGKLIDGWDRYKKAGIKVWNTKTNKYESF